MIDIHSHILPGRDDGAETLDDAIAMGRLAVESGTRIMFATPHVFEHTDLPRVADTAGQVAELQQALHNAGIALQLVPGSEVYPLDEVIHALDDGLPLTMGAHRNALLLDLPFTTLPIGLEQTIFLIQARGVQVILAHPERVEPIQRNPAVLEGLVHRGVLLQVTASSLLGRNGEFAEATARLFLRHRWVHFVASDAHSPVRRRPGMAQAARALIETVGAEVATELLTINGQRLIDGVTIPSNPLPFTPERPRRGFARWFGKRN